jgi:hypothetical protein
MTHFGASFSASLLLSVHFWCKGLGIFMPIIDQFRFTCAQEEILSMNKSAAQQYTE